jgi:signal peptidase II
MTLTSPILFRRGILLALLVLAADQAHKWYMIHHTSIPQHPLDVTSFFTLVMVWNTGISFGLFRGFEYGAYVLAATSLIIVGVLLVWLTRVARPAEAYAIGLICGGAVGNVIDRFHHGAVADFFSFHIGEYYWPAFNIADSVVFVGAAVLCYTSIFTTEKKHDDQPSGTDHETSA